MNALPPIDTARNRPIDTVPRLSVPRIAENHTIRSGDTLSGIVREYLMANGRDFSARSIYNGVKIVAAANDIANADRIFAGQRITVDIPGARLPESFPDVLDTVASERPKPENLGLYSKVLDGSATLTSTFGMRTHPISDGRRNHNGIDLAVERNTPIRSMRSGRVTFSGWQPGHGNTVVVQHGRGIQTQYSHAGETMVSVGDVVNPNTVLGLVGSTGNSTGPHLHFEVRQDGNFVNPMPYLMTNPVARESVNYSM